MRVSNLAGRPVLSTPPGCVDVVEASGGRFGPDPLGALEQWAVFSGWATEQDADDLGLGCKLGNGQSLPHDRASDHIFGIQELLCRLSAVCPLLPGDLIVTGPPAAADGGRTPRSPCSRVMSWPVGSRTSDGCATGAVVSTSADASVG